MPIPRTYLKRERNGKAPVLEVVIKCHMKQYQQSFYLTLYKHMGRDKKKKKIGTMRLDHVKGNTWETHFPGAIPRTERGKGYGIFLYSYAADLAAINQFTLISSDSPSVAAERCWNSLRLRKFYKVRKKGYNYYIKPKKPFSL